MKNTHASLGCTMFILLATLACGGGGGTSPTQPTTGGGTGGTGGGTPGTNRIIITASGVDPKALTIRVGERLTVTNSDSRSYQFSSDPHPDHTDCPELNQIGFIQPNQTKESGNFVRPQTCGFHDHNQPTNTSLQGRLTIIP